MLEILGTKGFTILWFEQCRSFELLRGLEFRNGSSLFDVWALDLSRRICVCRLLWKKLRRLSTGKWQEGTLCTELSPILLMRLLWTVWLIGTYCSVPSFCPSSFLTSVCWFTQLLNKFNPWTKLWLAVDGQTQNCVALLNWVPETYYILIYRAHLTAVVFWWLQPPQLFFNVTMVYSIFAYCYGLLVVLVRLIVLNFSWSFDIIYV